MVRCQHATSRCEKHRGDPGGQPRTPGVLPLPSCGTTPSQAIATLGRPGWGRLTEMIAAEQAEPKLAIIAQCRTS
jgi:hypothetical protein